MTAYSKLSTSGNGALSTSQQRPGSGKGEYITLNIQLIGVLVDLVFFQRSGAGADFAGGTGTGKISSIGIRIQIRSTVQRDVQGEKNY